MSVPRVLLLTGTPPGFPGVGGIFLRELCLAYPRGNICCFAVTPPNHRSTARDLDWLPITYAPLPRQDGFRRLGPHFAHLSGLLLRQYVSLVQVPALVRHVTQFGRRHGVEMVWAVLNDPVVINLARRTASALGARLVTTIWDPPEYLSMNLGFDCFSQHILLREFEKVLLMSLKCGVASEGMREEYKKRYGIDSVVLIPGVHPSLRRLPAKELSSEKQFTIGFAGSLYATDAWQALLSALSKLDWRIEGRDVIIRMLGANVSFQGQGKMYVEYLGWRSPEETVELISQVDVAYLPYWFDQSHSLSVRLCFPGKLTTYLAAGRPVFLHGPEDSSPARFLRRFPVGLCCHSLEEAEIVESLRRFVTDREFYAAAGQGVQMAIDQELDLRIFRRRFATLIGIQEDELVPLGQYGFDSTSP